MSKSEVKTYTVERRFDIWVSREIQAESLEAAVRTAQDMKDITKFITFKAGTEYIDSNLLPGTGVRENW